MSDIDVSFIVPVYNTPKEKLLRCFNSICKINSFSYEIIIIDDGSQEKTALICKEFAKLNPGFRYLWKENSGVSQSRNMGIKEAYGRYIYFVDSDDEIIADGISYVNLSSDADIIFTDLLLKTNNNYTIHRSFTDKSTKYKIENFILNSLLDGILFSPCSKFIKTSFIIKNRHRFNNSMVVGEDAVFIFGILGLKPVLDYVNQVTYIYHFEQNSGNKRFKKYTFTIVNNYEYMDKIFRKTIETICKDTKKRYSYIIKKQLLELEVSWYIKQLFGTVSELYLCKKLDNKYKKKIWNMLAAINQKKVKNCNIIRRYQYILMYKKMWFIIGLLARFRKTYLEKIKD